MVSGYMAIILSFHYLMRMSVVICLVTKINRLFTTVFLINLVSAAITKAIIVIDLNWRGKPMDFDKLFEVLVVSLLLAIVILMASKEK